MLFDVTVILESGPVKIGALVVRNLGFLECIEC